MKYRVSIRVTEWYDDAKEADSKGTQDIHYNVTLETDTPLDLKPIVEKALYNL